MVLEANSCGRGNQRWSTIFALNVRTCVFIPIKTQVQSESPGSGHQVIRSLVYAGLHHRYHAIASENHPLT